jgi:hypothetical protein
MHACMHVHMCVFDAHAFHRYSQTAGPTSGRVTTRAVCQRNFSVCRQASLSEAEFSSVK